MDAITQFEFLQVYKLPISCLQVVIRNCQTQETDLGVQPQHLYHNPYLETDEDREQ